VVLATGAIERPLVFRATTAGDVAAGAGQTYLIATAYGWAIAVIVTAADAAYQAALDLHAAV